MNPSPKHLPHAFSPLCSHLLLSCSSAVFLITKPQVDALRVILFPLLSVPLFVHHSRGSRLDHLDRHQVQVWTLVNRAACLTQQCSMVWFRFLGLERFNLAIEVVSMGEQRLTLIWARNKLFSLFVWFSYWPIFYHDGEESCFFRAG